MMSDQLPCFKRRFEVSWTSLLAAWRGFGSDRRVGTIPDIQEFALKKLETATEGNSSLAQLATISEREGEKVDGVLESLASSEHINYETEVLKWVVCLLENKLGELPKDPLYGLLQLTEFWADLGFPGYSPHRVQGEGNGASPTDYYTEENYLRAVNQHKEWIEKQTRQLSDHQSLGTT
jgi:hypothetical protein